MKRQGKAFNGYEMTSAKVMEVEPLSIAVNGQVISDHIVHNGLLTSDKDEELQEILDGEEFISDGLKQFLTDLYKELRVQAGDNVLVQRVGNSFFICGKVAE
ncbi:MAG: hypothetical protein NC389_09870 [Acetatifactor muris]|nr:hypothetical protein [Acetatifactor muris]